ncbi:MAG: glycoside hydrolase family 127 protein [Verrucomicrobiota bacterium]
MLLSGATDIAAETGDPQLLRMIGRVWRNATQKNLYVTGGIGPSAHNEGFTADYDLPNRTAYQETCASVALAQWNHRLALLYGDARYADVMERSLYNGVLAGVSLDGTRFFYVNPLESVGTHHRSDWFGCACCPPNVARTLASLGGYAYAVSPEALWINLYIQSAATANVHGQKVVFDVTTDYPWNGKVTVRPKLAEPSRFELRLRVPGWCRDASVAVNRVEPGAVLERGYLVIAREWREGDVVELNLPMPVEKIAAHPAVKDDAGQIALQRGPLVYCLEQADLTSRLAPVYLPAESELAARMAGTLLGGVVVLEGTAQSPAEMAWKNQLYQPLAKAHSIPITAIPYYAWDNRSPGPMKVWLPIAPEPTVTGGLERQAEVSLSFTSSNCQPGGINDGLECKASGDQPPAVCHWWPHKGGTEWAQYRWRKPVQIAGAKVFWFDDTGRGQCRLPAAWQLQYADGTDWRPVQVTDPYQVARDQWCDVHFQPITTTALRLVVEMQSGWAAGVHEWQVIEAAD